MSDLARNIAALSPERRKLLEKLLKKEGVAVEQTLILPQPRVGGPLPVSFAQQRLWFLDQLEPDSAAYNIPTAVRLTGQLDLAALEHSLHALVERHESLRTTFAAVDGQPVQLIAPVAELPLPLVDLRQLPQGEREAEAQRLAAEEARQPFNLGSGPLTRARLLRLAPDDHIMLLTMHHIVSDGWSIGVLVREIAALYAGQPLPPLPIQYADYAAWQRTWLAGDGTGETPQQRQLAYWRERFSGELPVLELPTDRPRPAVSSGRGEHYHFDLPGDLTGELRNLGQREGVTLFMTLLAAFQLLLMRYSGTDDIVVGTPIANRTRPELEGLIGFFVNTLALRTDLSGEPGFRELLRRVRETALGAFAHQDVPFEMVVEAVQPERNLSRTPLFQVMFVLQNLPQQGRSLPGLSMRQLETHSGVSSFDLTLNISEQGDGLHAIFEYSSDLFEAATIERMAGHFATLLRAIVATPDTPITRLPLLTEAEQHALLHAYNPPAPLLPAPVCLHHTFAAVVARQPHAPALTAAPQRRSAAADTQSSRSYQELNAQANQLAHYLQQVHGVGPGQLVALRLERTPLLVVAVLAILKAGAAYLPLDLSYPPERVQFILDDAQPTVLLTEQTGDRRPATGNLTGDRRPATGAIPSVALDDWSPFAVFPTTTPTSTVSPDDLAYVIYTSGSTGQPKGCRVSHANVARLFTATQHWFGFGPADVWTLFHSIAFDFSVWELFGALLYGGRLVVVPYLTSRDPLAFYQLLVEERVTVVNQTPSAFRALMQAEATLGVHPNLAVRTVIFGGEALDLPSLRPWFARHGDQRPQLVNMYGITETTVHVTYRPLTEADSAAGTGSLIGGPIPDLQLYLLDRHMQPVPLGVVGELYVGGAGVAQGYLNRAELTAERFLVTGDRGRATGAKPAAHDLLAPVTGLPSPVYRTGDLARRLPNGDLEYLGRADQQVKLRGFRIELGDIEAALARHPAVREAVVLLRDERLVAYVVLQEPRTKNQEPASAQRGSWFSVLGSFLKEKLPDYMVPSAFVELDAFPLTTNGKLDRTALPAPTWAPAPTEFTAPRTPTEELLASLWANLLEVTAVGREANFFALGGHSLLATRMVSRIRDAFGVELPLRDLFESPTLAGLAEQIERTRRGAALPPITPVERVGHLPLSFGQQRFWFLDQLEPGSPAYNMPDAVRLTGQLDLAALEAALSAVVQRHESLRTSFGSVDGKPVQVIAPAAPIHIPLTDLRHLPPVEREAEARRLAAEEAARPFDLATGPLLRVGLLRLADDEHIALLTMHHIVSDGWSGQVLVREIAALYGGAGGSAAGEPETAPLPPLPPLPVQYADYAAWQRATMQGDVLARQLEFWKNHLAGAPPLLELPTDRPRPPVQGYRGGRLPFALPAALSRQLLELSRAENATPFMLLLAAFQVLLMRYSGADDIVVGTPIANRGRAELEGLIGFFVNTLALRTDLRGEPSFRQLLRQVRETALNAYAHQDVPFEMVVDALQPERNLSHTPLFQVMFILQNLASGNQRNQQIALDSGLTLSSIPPQLDISPFDLTLTLEETAEGLAGEFEYSSDLFERATIERMVGHFQQLLEGIVATPDTDITRLPLLTPAELAQLAAWNDTAAPLPERCIHDLIAEQAARTPEAIAVTGDGNAETQRHRDAEVMSVELRSEHVENNTGRFSFSTLNAQFSILNYAELNARANQLAHYLRSLGVGRESIVGVCMERSPELMIALLAILKAGGAFLPLDPNYPAERLRYMIEDSQPAVLLTGDRGRATGAAPAPPQPPRQQGEEDLLASVPSTSLRTGSGLRSPVNVSDWTPFAQLPTENPVVETHPDDLAYIIYTSGSTGQPKGVMITHRGLLNHNLGVIGAYGLTAADRVLQFSTINFDSALEEIFPTWLCGATLVLRGPEAVIGVDDLLALVEQQSVSMIIFPTAYWHTLMAALADGTRPLPASLRLVAAGGEAAAPEHLATWRRLAGGRVRWINGYGPTEATIMATTFEPPADFAGATVPIGRPMPNVQAHILDHHMQPVPVGVIGELYIGGVQVGRGYLNRPELTAERFLDFGLSILDFGLSDNADQSQIHLKSKIYKTGDLARYRADGSIEFLGRADTQVKLRGFRIELGEIEATLLHHPAVREAAVVVREDTPGAKRLVAYVVPDKNAETQRPRDAEEVPPPQPLRTQGRAEQSSIVNRQSSIVNFLREKLPDHMVPTAIVELDALPLTPSGKVDRKALPAPSVEMSAPPADTEPHTDAEATLARIWAEVLGVNHVRREANFFELGGDSILSIQVIARANQAGLRLTPRQLFEAPTVAQLALLAGTGTAVVAEQGPVTGNAPLTPIQRWFFMQQLPNPHHWNQSLLLSVAEPLEPAALEAAVAALLAHHDALRAQFATEDTEDTEEKNFMRLSVSSVPSVAEIINLSDAADVADAITAHTAAAQASLNLERGPLLRVLLFECGAGRGQRLFLCVHHLVMDGVSWRILLEDLQLAYSQASASQPLRLPPKTTSFKTWAERLATYAQSEALRAELSFWREQTDSVPFPLDYPGGDNHEDSARSLVLALSADETRALLHEVPPVYRTEINDVLLTALALAHSRWTGRDDLLVELEGHGREDLFADVDISRTVGWFTTTFPVKLTLVQQQTGDGRPETGASRSCAESLAPVSRPRSSVNLGAALKSIKEQLRAVPRKGIGYGLLRHMAGEAIGQELATAAHPAISFNYLGQFDQLLPEGAAFGPAPESPGPDRDGRGQRDTALGVTASVAGGVLRVEWSYSANLHQRATVEALAEGFMAALREIIAHCQNPDAGGATPSDFGLANLNQAKLDKLMAKFKKK
jgi:amino acid adenylation domain-containing protein/non-ribosomal peptide synthase protein (TIGR01720 family)